MKKLFLTAMISTAVVASAFAQGEVNFATGATAGNRINTNSIVGGPANGTTSATANTYYFALFVSVTQTSVGGNTNAISGAQGASYVFSNLGNGSAATGWELVGYGANTASAGRFGPTTQGTNDAGQAPLNSDGSLTAVGAGPAGSTANFVSIGWSANIGSTLTALEAWYNNGLPATAGWLGESQVGIGLTLGNGTSIPASSVMGPNAGQVAGYLLGEIPAVPEPGTLALAALGGASMLLLRRKK
jgi:hypothetical protein